jgi:hypothetical protein
MDKYLFFFILSSALLIISVITICLAPIINGAGTVNFYNIGASAPANEKNLFKEWGTASCQLLNDDYKHKKDIGGFNGDTNGREETQTKRKINDCKRHKAMFGLEYAALISDVVLGFICMLLGLIHYLEQGKPFETTSGLIGIASGGIATVLTIVYVVYSGIIFNNEYIRDSASNILYDNHAYLHWNGNKYVNNYDEQKLEKDLDVQFIKYKDLGKKGYNYDSEIYQMSLDSNSEFSNCQTYVSLTEQKTYGASGAKKCEYIWRSSFSESVQAKYLYDRWITSIILSVVICVCGIGLAFFGFLLFKGN